MKSKHSEGPWVVRENVILSEPEGAPVATVDASRATGWVPETIKANARLIAASPAGYDLALHVMAVADDAYLSGHPEWPEIVSKARALIKAVEVSR